MYCIFHEPKKEISRCCGIIYTLPKLLWKEFLKKHDSKNKS